MRYDPVRLEEQLFKQPVKWLVRNVELFVPLGTFVAKVIFDIQVRRPRREPMNDEGWGAYLQLRLLFVLQGSKYPLVFRKVQQVRLPCTGMVLASPNFESNAASEVQRPVSLRSLVPQFFASVFCQQHGRKKCWHHRTCCLVRVDSLRTSLSTFSSTTTDTRP